MTRFVELLVGRPEQGENLLVEGLETEHHSHRRIGSVANVQQINPFEALEDPAHRRAVGRFLDLVGDRLPSGRQLLAQSVLGEPIDEQAEHHHEAEGNNARGLPRKMLCSG